ncbi:MAG: hypothetical protein IJX17_05110 [Clostridia bacterium]|nr:hypothetical protein [Clostridia bacterium]
MDKVEFEYKINNKIYNEHFAKYLLSKVFDISLEKSKNADRPDILFIHKNESYGIEVTTVIDPFYNALKRYRQVWAKSNMTLEEITHSLPTILKGKLALNIEGNIVLRSPYNKHLTENIINKLIEMVQDKYEKLQDYEKFEKNDLFVFATNLSENINVDKIKLVLDGIDKTNFKTTFDNIIIFNYNELQIYPKNQNEEVRVIKISNETIESCDKLATFDVFSNEK